MPNSWTSYRFELRRRRLRKSSLEVRDGNVRGAAIACALGRLSQRVHRLRIAAGMGRQEVNGNPIRCLARTCEQAGGALVVSGTLLRAQLGVDARAHERVDERKPPAGLEDHRLGQSVGGAGGRVVVEAGELRCEGRLGRVAEHGDGASEGGALRWQAPQTSAHGSADALRAQLAGQAGVLATRRDPPPVELAEELQEQERVAAGRPLASSDEARIGLSGQQLYREHRDRLLAQPARLKDCDLGDDEQLVEQLLHRAGLGRPCRQHERQRHARQPAGEIDQPAQRGDIRPVRVVHGHQQRLCVGQIDREPVEPVQSGKRRLGAGFRVGRKEDGLCQRRRPGQQGFTLLRVAGHHHWFQQLPDDPERQLALQLAAPRRQNAQFCRRRGPSGREQTRFADPRRPFEDHSPA